MLFKRLLFVLVYLVVGALSMHHLHGQAAITTITVVTEGTTPSANTVIAPSDAGNSITDDAGETFTVNYGQGSNIRVSSYTVNSTTFNNFLLPDTLVLNRTTPADRLVNIWYTLNSGIIDNFPPTNDVVNLDADEIDDADAIYLLNVVNAGYDNILVNEDPVGGGTIEVETERVDVIWFQGIQTSSPGTAIFPIVERGGNDNIVVAAITGLNPDGTPASYSTPIGIGENDWPGVGQSFDNYLILRREATGTLPLPLLPIGVNEGQGAQTIQGLAISFAEFGIPANTPVFGYSIFPADIVDGYVTGSGQILEIGAQTIAAGIDLTDISTFPTNTSSDDSGLDYVAGLSAAVSSDDNLIELVGPGGFKDGLATWLKANDGAFVSNGGATATEGDALTFWEDQAIGNHDFTTFGTAPTFRSTTSAINFNPTADFIENTETGLQTDDNEDFNVISDDSGFTRKAIYMVFRTNPNDVSTRQQLFEEGGGTNGLGLYIENGQVLGAVWNRGSNGTGSPFNDATPTPFISTAITPNTEYILSMEFDGSTTFAGDVTFYLNGQSFGNLPAAGILFNHADNIGLGDINEASRYNDGTTAASSFDGEIPEFIYCNEPSSFSLIVRQRIESYLAIKYGITLNQSIPTNYVSSDGLIIFNTSINASLGGFLEYNNDIAGIGRDDASELNQPASRSENTGSVVTIDRGFPISNDDSFLIWGNDGAALTETSSLTMPNDVESRLTRVWRVAERNDVLTTSVSFDLTGLGIIGLASDFSLLIADNSSDADFSNAEVIQGATINGNTITFTGISFTDGQYFTLGTQTLFCSPGGVQEDLVLWLRADEGTNTTVNGANVLTWMDQSNIGNNTAESNDGGGAPQEPTYNEVSTNFNPAINFTDPGNTNNSWLRTNTIPAVMDMSLVSVYSSTQADVSDFGAPFDAPAFLSTDDSNPGENYTLGQSGGQVHAKVITGDVFGARSAGSFNDGVAHMALATRVQSTAEGSVQLFLDAANVASAVSDVIDLDLGTGIGIGNHFQPFDEGGQLAGDISEAIVYADDLTSEEQNRVESYLAIKYGIFRNAIDNVATATVDERDLRRSDGTVIWDFDDQSEVYSNDVAGIGRDDLSCLDQRQSSSLNADGIVTIGNSAIAASNALNTAGFTEDNSFLIWGNDNASLLAADVNSVDVPSTVTSRMERIWHVQETGTVGSTAISFDLTGLGYGTSPIDFQLIVSDSETLADGAVFPAGSLANNILTFNGVDFTDGQFFSIGIGRTGCSPGGVTTNLQLWLRADAEVFNTGTTQAIDGQTVNGWGDLSPNEADASDPGNLTTFETNTINFNPAVEFNNDATSLEGTFTTSTAGLTQFTAAFFNSASGNDDALYEYRGGTADDRSFFINSRYGGANAFTQNINEDSWNIWSVDHPSGNTVNIFQNGADFETGYTATLSDAGAGTYNYTLGDDDTGNNDFVGFLGDIIAYQGVLTSIERRQVETYLAIKYGITIDQSTPTDYIFSDGSSVIWNATENSTFVNDIAGIGRDDASCFSQRQSRSQNADDILTVGLGTVAASNLDNPGIFDEDGDYFVWANDNGATDEGNANTVDVPATIGQRVSRIWRAQDTGQVGNTEIQFDLTDLGYDVTSAETFSLLVSDSPTMANATIITGASLDGNIISFSDIDLLDGQFFTLGTTMITCGPGGVNTGLALWLRADEEVFSDLGFTAAVDGASVQQWNDQSIPTDDGLVSTLGGGSPIAPSFETNVLNFNPVLRYVDPNSANAAYIETGSNNVGGDFTLISLFETGQADGTQGDFSLSPSILSAGGTVLDYGLGIENGQLFVNANSDNGFDAETTDQFNDNFPHFVTATRVQSTGAINIFVDSQSEATGTGSTDNLTDPTSFGIGNQSVGSLETQFAGDIGEAIVFSRVITDEERNRVDSYLGLKYGLTRDIAGLPASRQDYLAADGQAIWGFDAQGAVYYNDIFGVGRDDLSCFEQTQSMSQNADALVTFNVTGGFSENDAFLISGNDNANIEAPDNNERPANINSRLNREWRVQETGNVGPVEITYQLSQISGPLGIGTNNLTQLFLLVDDDGDFSSGSSLIEPTAINGSDNTATFTVDFTDGQFYTLGSFQEDALPITLISFDAQVNRNNDVRLEWVTASEENNAFFTIERSTDGFEFEAVALLDGAGTSTETIFYSFTDSRPINGRSFYRLRQTDFNGEFEFSQIESVFVEGQEEIGIGNVFPNPVRRGGTLQLAYDISADQTVELSYTDISGRLLYTATMQLSRFDTSISLPTDRLVPGLNLLKIVNERKEVTTLKLIVE